MEIHDNLIKLMTKKKLGRKELAIRLNIASATLKEKIDGKEPFYMSEIITVCNMLELDSASDVFFVNARTKSDRKRKEDIT